MHFAKEVFRKNFFPVSLKKYSSTMFKVPSVTAKIAGLNRLVF
jgi:hypothetical protein